MICLPHTWEANKHPGVHTWFYCKMLSRKVQIRFRLLTKPWYRSFFNGLIQGTMGNTTYNFIILHIQFVSKLPCNSINMSSACDNVQYGIVYTYMVRIQGSSLQWSLLLNSWWGLLSLSICLYPPCYVKNEWGHYRFLFEYLNSA